jgi:protease II
LQVNKLIDTFEAEYSYITNEGNKFYFRCNLDAPKYKVISFDITNVHDRSTWQQVVPEHSDVLEMGMDQSIQTTGYLSLSMFVCVCVSISLQSK